MRKKKRDYGAVYAAATLGMRKKGEYTEQLDRERID